MARVCREAGATVRCHAKLRDMNVAVSAQDERAVEVLASGLPIHHGAQLTVDVNGVPSPARASPAQEQHTLTEPPCSEPDETKN